MGKTGRQDFRGTAVDWFIRLAAAVGLGFMLYLTRLHYAGGSQGSVCELGKELSCETVNTSVYSQVLGVPVAVMGAAYFIGVLGLSFSTKKHKNRWIALMTAAALPLSLYLTATEILVIKSVCLFCELAKVLMAGILGVSIWTVEKKSGLTGGLAAAATLGALMAGMIWYVQRVQFEVARGFDNLAACMSRQGVVMYGAKTCQVCARQKAYLGRSMAKIAEIECDPRVEGARPELCLEKQITSTPTWIREAEGRELKRMSGFYKADKLAEFSDCQEALARDREQKK